jgi:hypothetical protein
MSPEPLRRFPNWAERERQGDMRWIGDNLHILWPAAKSGYESLGRGAVVIDATSQPVPGLGNPFTYMSRTDLEPLHDEDVQRMMREYDPTQEVVVMLLKTRQRTSAYRVRPQPRR